MRSAGAAVAPGVAQPLGPWFPEERVRGAKLHPVTGGAVASHAGGSCGGLHGGGLWGTGGV